jgi:hypothetical protein
MELDLSLSRGVLVAGEQALPSDVVRDRAIIVDESKLREYATKRTMGGWEEVVNTVIYINDPDLPVDLALVAPVIAVLPEE